MSPNRLEPIRAAVLSGSNHDVISSEDLVLDADAETIAARGRQMFGYNLHFLRLGQIGSAVLMLVISVTLSSQVQATIAFTGDTNWFPLRQPFPRPDEFPDKVLPDPFVGTVSIVVGGTIIGPIGHENTGTLTINGGSDVISSKLTIGGSDGVPGNGTVTITDSGSTLILDLPPDGLGTGGDLYVGSLHMGELSITEGARVTNTNNAFIGGGPGSAGEVTLSGFTDTSSWQTGSGAYIGFEANSVGKVTIDSTFPYDPEWQIGRTLNVGYRGKGTLMTSGGGKVTSLTSYIGREVGSDGNVTVSGGNASWTVQAADDLIGRLHVAGSGTGTLMIESGGTVTSGTGFIGLNSGSTGEVTVRGHNSVWKTNIFGSDTGQLVVGSSGMGRLAIEAGGKVSSGLGFIGYESGSDGQVTVSGTGSVWETKTNGPDTGQLQVGRSGSGELRIESGASVTNAGRAFIALQPGSTGRVKIAGDGSKWKSDGHIFVSGFTTPGGEGTLELQGGTVETEEVTINSSESGGGQLRGYGYVQGLNRMGTITPLKEIRNRGRIIAEGEYLDAPTGWFGTVGTGQLWIDGNFVQEADGTLELTVTDVNYAGGGTIPGGGRQIPVRIHEHAQLDGKLKVAHADISGSLNAGDRYHLMEWDSFSGRFQEFSGSVIEDRPDIFFGLHYANNGLDVITLETPRLFDGDGNATIPLSAQTKGTELLLISGGYGGGRDFTLPFAQDLATATHEHRKENGGGWKTVTVDWSPYGTGLKSAVASDLIGDPNGLPILHDIGESTAFWMKESGIFSNTLHLVAISGGVWHADGLADRLRALGYVGNMHLTTLDGYIPVEGGFVIDGQSATEEIGDTVDFADNYIDSRFRSGGSTYVRLFNAMNFDVTRFLLNSPSHSDLIDRIGFNLAAHTAPAVFYQYSAFGLLSKEFGFPLSQEMTGMFPAYNGKVRRGGMLFLHPALEQVVEREMHAPLDLNEEMTIPSDTGMVTITEDGDAIMTTGSPVMLTVFPNISQPFNVLQVEFGFSEQSAGLLSVYFDGSQVFAINGAEVFAAAHDEFDEVPPNLDFDTGALVLGDYFEPGFHTLLIRLDSPTGGQSSVHISNIRFGLETVVAVPEPPAIVIAFLTCVMTVGLRRRFFASTKPIPSPSCRR